MVGLFKRRAAPPLHTLIIALVDTIRELEVEAKRQDAAFRSPIFEQSGRRLAEWGEYAFKAVDRSPARHVLLELEHLYEAARLVVASKQEGLELAFMYLEMAGVLSGGRESDTVRALGRSWSQLRGDFGRAARLKQVCCAPSSVYSRPPTDLQGVAARLCRHVLTATT